jgi:hypothetical protein
VRGRKSKELLEGLIYIVRSNLIEVEIFGLMTFNFPLKIPSELLVDLGRRHEFVLARDRWRDLSENYEC